MEGGHASCLHWGLGGSGMFLVHSQGPTSPVRVLLRSKSPTMSSVREKGKETRSPVLDMPHAFCQRKPTLPLCCSYSRVNTHTHRNTYHKLTHFLDQDSFTPHPQTHSLRPTGHTPGHTTCAFKPTDTLRDTHGHTRTPPPPHNHQ